MLATQSAAATQTTVLADDTDKGEAASLTYRDILTVANFLPRKQKILIIGGSETKEVHLRGKFKSLGFDFDKNQLEFELE